MQSLNATLLPLHTGLHNTHIQKLSVGHRAEKKEEILCPLSSSSAYCLSCLFLTFPFCLAIRLFPLSLCFVFFSSHHSISCGGVLLLSSSLFYPFLNLFHLSSPLLFPLFGTLYFKCISVLMFVCV